MVTEQTKQAPRTEEKAQPEVQAVFQDIKPPEHMTSDGQKKIEQAAAELVRQLTSTKDEVAKLRLEGKISSLGMRSERRAVDTISELLKSRVGDMLRIESKQGGGSRSVTKDLLALRGALREINPTELEKSFLKNIPFIGDRIIKILDRIASKYDRVSGVINEVKVSLQKAEARTLQDNEELYTALENLKMLQKDVEENTYLGKLVVKNIDELISNTADTQKRQELTDVLHNVITRVDALARTSAMFAQSYVQIKLTTDTNLKLARGISIAVNQGMVVVSNAMLIYTALQRQQEIIKALGEYKEFLENTIVSVAQMTKDNMAKVYGFLREPLAAMDKIKEANGIMQEALSDRNIYIQDGIKAARENIPQLEKITKDLMDSVKGVKVGEIDSIEVGNLPTRPIGGTERPQI